MKSSFSRLPADGDMSTVVDGWIVGVIGDHLDPWRSDPTHLLVQPLELPVLPSLPLPARWESVPVLTGLALGCFANWAGGCEAQHLIIVRLHLDPTVDKRKGGDYPRNRDI